MAPAICLVENLEFAVLMWKFSTREGSGLGMEVTLVPTKMVSYGLGAVSGAWRMSCAQTLCS